MCHDAPVPDGARHHQQTHTVRVAFGHARPRRSAPYPPKNKVNSSSAFPRQNPAPPAPPRGARTARGRRPARQDLVQSHQPRRAHASTCRAVPPSPSAASSPFTKSADRRRRTRPARPGPSRGRRSPSRRPDVIGDRTSKAAAACQARVSSKCVETPCLCATSQISSHAWDSTEPPQRLCRPRATTRVTGKCSLSGRIMAPRPGEPMVPSSNVRSARG